MRYFYETYETVEHEFLVHLSCDFFSIFNSVPAIKYVCCVCNFSQVPNKQEGPNKRVGLFILSKFHK